MARRKKTRYKCRFPDRPTWTVGVVRALDDSDSLCRAAVAIVPGKRRHFLPLDAYLPSDRVTSEAARLIRELYETRPWYGRPEQVQCEDPELTEMLREVLPRSVRVSAVDASLDLRRAQNDFAEYVEDAEDVARPEFRRVRKKVA